MANDTTPEIALIDLSSIAYPIFLMSGAQPDPDYASQQIVARIRALTAAHPKAAVCCDKGKSFRHELNPTYKAQREAAPQALHHQIALAKERLAADGYPVWAVAGFEADDLIASAVTAVLSIEDTRVLVVSADKDLLQLVGPRVSVLSPATNHAYNAEAVFQKFGVRPAQIVDYLSLVGDASDNVKGAAGIGPKKAAELLGRYGDLDEVFRNLDAHGTQFKPAMASALREFQPRLAETRALITLRTDVGLPFAELDTDRAVQDAAPMEAVMEATIEAPAAAPEVPAAPAVQPAPPLKLAPAPEQAKPSAPAIQGEVVDALPAPYERQLEPRTLPQAMQLANHLHTARMFSGYGSPQAVLSTILAGRELGLQAIAALRAFHVIEGKHALAADAMRGLVLKSGMAEYFRIIERTALSATFETKRKGDPGPVSLAYTVEEARNAFGFTPDLADKDRALLEGKWQRSGWGKHTPDMLAARASSKLARLVYADLLFGLYSPAELSDTVAA